MIENCASTPLYSVLKRKDEKFVTEHAYDNPRFVEDVVREVYLGLKQMGFKWFNVEPARPFQKSKKHKPAHKDLEAYSSDEEAERICSTLSRRRSKDRLPVKVITRGSTVYMVRNEG